MLEGGRLAGRSGHLLSHNVSRRIRFEEQGQRNGDTHLCLGINFAVGGMSPAGGITPWFKRTGESTYHPCGPVTKNAII